MNNTFVLWGGAAVVVILGVMLFMQPTTTGTATNSVTSTTTDTSGIPSGRDAAKPFVVTTGFASVSSTTAVVVGTVNPNGAETSYWFEYGTTLSLGFSAGMTTAPAGYQQLGASGFITGLKPATSYYFRLSARNAYGTVNGGPYNFITTAK